MLERINNWILNRSKELSTKTGILQVLALVGIVYSRKLGLDFNDIVNEVALAIIGMSSLTAILKPEK